MLLSRIIEEVEPKFRSIGDDLNAMGLEKTVPKSKTDKSRSALMAASNPVTDGIGGKAGKHCYFV